VYYKHSAEVIMDEKIEKAFQVANYMATLSNQRRIILEEYAQKLVYYINGATFNVDYNLINFAKNLIDLEHTEDIAFVDANNQPVIIADVQDFLDNIVSVYFEAVNEYHTKFAEIKRKRNVKDLVDL
jgi:hypothetical protein